MRGFQDMPESVVDGVQPSSAVTGVSLDRSGLMGRIDLDEFLALAEELSALVGAIHDCGVIHNAVRPTAVMVRAESPRLSIPDFATASTFAEEVTGFEAIGGPVEALAYASPEQSGRINRTVDYRTDLYSLGATLYALATGAPPFSEATGMGMVHAHLTQLPQSPRESAPWLPECVAHMLLRLLAKEPDDRYQSATGLAHDLAALRRARRDGRPLESVPLRTRDMPLSLRPSRRLYGRADELAVLEAALDDVLQGKSRHLFIAGRSGVGKTALINELQRSVTLRHGLFARGKFEQFQAHRPFLAWSQSLRHLCHRLLTEPDTDLADLRRRLMTTLGPHAAALVEIIPEVGSLLGDMLPAPEAPSPEMPARLRSLSVRLIREIALRRKPVVLVLDDLQWADQPSLHLLAALLAEPSMPGLMVIGSYRDDAIDASHPLALILRQSTGAGPAPPVMTLENLPLRDITQMLADMLRASAGDVRSLADIVLGITAGNPYFVMSVLQAWHRDGLLAPDFEHGRWQWDERRIVARRDDSSVAAWLRDEVTNLPRATAEALATAACLGTDFSLGQLALATGHAVADLVTQLMPALERGMLVTSSAAAVGQLDPRAVLRFEHDRMQQAAYQLLDTAARRQRHRAIARRLWSAANPDDETLARQAAEHFANAGELIVAAHEKQLARGLFLRSARQSWRAGAYDVAERFLRQGIGLLPENAWQTARDEVWQLYVELHVTCYSEAKHEEADEIYALLAAQAASPAMLVDVACVQVMSLSNRTRYADAVGLGCELLRQLGVDVPREQALLGLDHELAALLRHVTAEGHLRLPLAAAVAEPGRDGAAKLMNRMIPAAFFLDPHVACWLAARCGQRWIEEGYRHAYAYPMACIMLATISRRGEYAIGYQAATDAFAAVAAAEHGVEAARTQHVLGLFSCHWYEPLEHGLRHAREAFDGLLLAGEMEFACYTFFTSQAAVLDTCRHLDELAPEIDAALEFAAQTGNRHAEPAYLAYRQFLRALTGRTLAPGSFTDADFDEENHLARADLNPMARCYFHLHRAIAACIFGDDDELIRHAEAAVDLASYITGFYPTVLVWVMHALGLVCRVRRGADLAGVQPQLTAIRGWLAARAADAPMNFAHLADFVEAACQEVLGSSQQAFVLFERSMRRASANRRPWHLALITEQAGRCFMRCDLDHAGRLLLGEACDHYRAFGADGKAAALEAELPFLRDRAALMSENRAVSSLHEQGLIAVSQALAAERSVPRLVARVVDYVSQLTGATDVRLLALDVENRWMLKGGTRAGVPIERMTREAAEAVGWVAASVVRLGLATLEPTVSEDAVLDSRFSHDPYFQSLPRCSLLAMPVFVQGRPKAFVILENRLFRDAFTPRHIATITALCGQLAISIDNARMYESLERKVAERTREAEEARAQERRSEERQRAVLQAKLKTSLAAAAVAHEIKLPLSNILLGTKLAAEALERVGPVAAPLEPMMAGLVAESNRVVATIEKMRMLLRNVQTELEPVDLVAVIQTAILYARPFLDEHAVALHAHGLSGACVVRGDAVQLQGAVGNLLRNAVDAVANLPVEGRRVSIELRPGSARSAAVEIIIGDSGPGLPGDALSPPLESTKPHGSGLGLFVVQSTVENHGGRFAVGRSPLGGAELRMLLPRMTSVDPET